MIILTDEDLNSLTLGSVDLCGLKIVQTRDGLIAASVLLHSGLSKNSAKDMRLPLR